MLNYLYPTKSSTIYYINKIIYQNYYNFLTIPSCFLLFHPPILPNQKPVGCIRFLNAPFSVALLAAAINCNHSLFRCNQKRPPIQEGSSSFKLHHSCPLFTPPCPRAPAGAARLAKRRARFCARVCPPAGPRGCPGRRAAAGSSAETARVCG